MNDELSDAIQAVHEEAGGALAIVVVRQTDVPALIAACLTGSETANAVFGAVRESLERVRNAPRRKPALCAACPRCVRKGDEFAIAIAFPHRESPSLGLGMVVCRRCDDGGDLQEKIATALRRIWPHAKTVDVTHPEGGRA